MRWDMSSDVRRRLEERTWPAGEYLIRFNRKNSEQFFTAAEFCDERTELLEHVGSA